MRKSIQGLEIHLNERQSIVVEAILTTESTDAEVIDLFHSLNEINIFSPIKSDKVVSEQIKVHFNVYLGVHAFVNPNVSLSHYTYDDLYDIGFKNLMNGNLNLSHLHDLYLNPEKYLFTHKDNAFIHQSVYSTSYDCEHGYSLVIPSSDAPYFSFNIKDILVVNQDFYKALPFLQQYEYEFTTQFPSYYPKTWEYYKPSIYNRFGDAFVEYLAKIYPNYQFDLLWDWNDYLDNEADVAIPSFNSEFEFGQKLQLKVKINLDKLHIKIKQLEQLHQRIIKEFSINQIKNAELFYDCWMNNRP